MEALTKNQVIENMYSLRAGLSAIVLESEKMQTIVEDYDNEIKNRVQNIQNKFKIENITSGKSADELSRYILNDCEQDFKSKISSKRSSVRRDQPKKLLFALLYTILAAAIGAAFGYMLKFNISVILDSDAYNDNLSPLLFLIFWPLIAVTFGGLIFFIRKIFKKLSGYVSDIVFIKNYVQRTNSFIQCIPELKEFVAKNRADKAATIVPMFKSCNDFYNVIYKKYSGILDERDWKHLDFVIFYFETRRADSVKEALQLVDREIQTERIIQAIEKATVQICGTLRAGFAALGQAINSLSEQVRLSGAAQTAQMARLTNSVNLNNALQAKANINSAQLVESVGVLRTNAEYAAMRLRNRV